MENNTEKNNSLDDWSKYLSEEESPSWLKNGGYMLFTTIFHFFIYRSKNKIKHKNLDLENVAVSLYENVPNGLPDEVLEKTLRLINHQRIIENTRARKRLEKWATTLIPCYLFVVGLILVLNALSKVYLNLEQCLISDTIISVILSTTTINIIGLVIIVLKGHFENDNDVQIKSNEDDVKNYTSTSSISGKRIKYLYH